MGPFIMYVTIQTEGEKFFIRMESSIKYVTLTTEGGDSMGLSIKYVTLLREVRGTNVCKPYIAYNTLQVWHTVCLQYI
jgi:hypothetical protein